MNRLRGLRNEPGSEGLTVSDQAPMTRSTCENTVDNVDSGQSPERRPEINGGRERGLSFRRSRPARFGFSRFAVAQYTHGTEPRYQIRKVT